MKLKSTIFGLIASSLLVSCSTGNEVVSNGKIQKRKYNDGYYVASGNNFKKDATNPQAKNEAITYNTNEEIARVYETAEPAMYTPETASLNETNEAPVVLAENTDAVESTTTVTTEEQSTRNEIARPLNVKKSEQKVTFKPGRVTAKKAVELVTENAAAAESGLMLVLLVILAIIIPPLAVFIFEGATGRFWIDLILAIVGFGVGWWLLGGGLAYLCALAAVIYALLIVLSVI